MPISYWTEQKNRLQVFNKFIDFELLVHFKQNSILTGHDSV